MLHNTSQINRIRVPSSRNEGIVISCRVRLARNLHDERFPDWATERDRKRVLSFLAPIILHLMDDPRARLVEIGSIDKVKPNVLHELHLISSDLIERGTGGGVVISGNNELSVMINEEDHLRIQVIRNGFDLRKALEIADEFDTMLEGRLKYAYDQRLGYLTACPSNVGTGMRASVMVHLLGLRLSNDLDAVIRSLQRMHYAVRGMGGEGTEAAGHMFQISNSGSLGQNEEEVIAGLEHVVGEVARQELQARMRLMRDKPEIVYDTISRTLALAQNAYLMQAEEALDHLSVLRMAVLMKLIKGINLGFIDALYRLLQPWHMQDLLGRKMEVFERDKYRAEWMQERTKSVTRNF